MVQTGSRKATVGCPECGRLNRVDLDRLAAGPKCGHCARPLPLDRPLPVGDQNLDRVIADSAVPVLVDFYADWCGPCKAMAPVLDEIAREQAGQALVAKLDTDRNPAMAGRYGIRGIPTLILFHGGREVAREVGAVSKARLATLLQQAR